MTVDDGATAKWKRIEPLESAQRFPLPCTVNHSLPRTVSLIRQDILQPAQGDGERESERQRENKRERARAHSARTHWHNAQKDTRPKTEGTGSVHCSNCCHGVEKDILCTQLHTHTHTQPSERYALESLWPFQAESRGVVGSLFYSLLTILELSFHSFVCVCECVCVCKAGPICCTLRNDLLFLLNDLCSRSSSSGRLRERKAAASAWRCPFP